jgi:hypothetical protein
MIFVMCMQIRGARMFGGVMPISPKKDNLTQGGAVTNYPETPFCKATVYASRLARLNLFCSNYSW